MLAARGRRVLGMFPQEPVGVRGAITVAKSSQRGDEAISCRTSLTDEVCAMRYACKDSKHYRDELCEVFPVLGFPCDVGQPRV